MRSAHFSSVCKMMALAGIVFISVAACKKDKDKDMSSDKIQFSGTLSGQAENPPITTSGTGTVTAVYDPVTKTLQYTFSWSNLSGNAINMHFHIGAVGVNGGVTVPITGFPQAPSGQWSGTSDSLDETQVTALMAGEFYGNIHTPDHPGGEIRAQMTKE